MDRWLTAVEKDHSTAPLATKIVRGRPKDVQDRCTTNGYQEKDLPGAGQLCGTDVLGTRYGTPRTVAGEDIANDTQKCALKPLQPQDYYPILFTADQWARLRSTFPRGVCDWRKRGIYQVGTTPWLTYQDASGDVVYGGRALPVTPRRSGEGWTSPSFR
jgi:hypothetical protein